MIRQLFQYGAIAITLGAAATAQAQGPTDYPGTKPVRMIVPFPPGGGTDILSRIIAQKLTEQNQWTVVADNRAGAGATKVPYSEFLQDVRSGRIKSATLQESPSGTVILASTGDDR